MFGQTKQYKFNTGGTIIFLCGAPLVGKSSVASQLVSKIQDCSLQSMDIVRLFAQEYENLKPKSEQNDFVQLGSCDSYKLIGDGKYSPETLIEGYKKYAASICSHLSFIISRLEVQGAHNVIFEGVQLLPECIVQYLKGNNVFIELIGTKANFERNKNALFGRDQNLQKRYETEKLLVIQEEISKQRKRFNDKMSFVITMNSSIEQVVNDILGELKQRDVIAM